jgi:hypothetical protein
MATRQQCGQHLTGDIVLTDEYFSEFRADRLKNPRGMLRLIF